MRKTKTDEDWYLEIREVLDTDVKLESRNPVNITYVQMDWLLKQYEEKKILELKQEESDLAIQKLKESYLELESAVSLDMTFLERQKGG